MRQIILAILTPLACYFSGVHPNTLTFLSLITGILAGGAYWLTHHGHAFYWAGGILVALSGIFDSLDGIVAREYERTTNMGDFLDHLCDRLVDVFILIGLAFSPQADSTLGLLVVLVALFNGYFGTQIEASFGKRYYGGAGKPELFIGIIGFSFFLAIFPEVFLRIAGRSVYFINLFFIVLGFATLISLVHRFRYAYKLCSSTREQEGPWT